jgi:hypothetical protein
LGAAVLVLANTNSGKQVRRQIQNSELADQARHAFTDALNSLQDPKARQAAIDAWNATGIPSKTGQLFQNGVRTLQDPHTRDEAMQLADQTRQQLQELPGELSRRFQKPEPKRFFFV